MLEIDFNPNETDDADFIRLVAQIVCGVVSSLALPNFCILKIDHWFDHKWLGFSGKTLGALGVWKGQLTIPPFVANRIIFQRHYGRDSVDGTYRPTDFDHEIHHRGPSEENLRRYVTRLEPSTALFWYSSHTAQTGRGSLMGYVPVQGDVWPWFLAFNKVDKWRIARRKGIHEYEIRKFVEASEQIGIDKMPNGA